MAKSSTSYQSGQTGNPKGRPAKGYSITEMFRSMLDSDSEMREKLAKVILRKALDGDMAACRLIWSYMDGLPTNKISITELPRPLPLLGGVTSEN